MGTLLFGTGIQATSKAKVQRYCHQKVLESKVKSIECLQLDCFFSQFDIFNTFIMCSVGNILKKSNDFLDVRWKLKYLHAGRSSMQTEVQIAQGCTRTDAIT